MSSTLKNLFVLLILILLGALGYFLFFNADDGSIVTTDGERGAAAAAIQTREFKRILDDLNSIELESELFTDRTFLNLIDHSQPIVDRPYGSTNPFVTSQ